METQLKSAVLVAADRTDKLASLWVDLAANPNVDFAELAVVPPQMLRMDLKLALALKNIFPRDGKHSQLYKDVVHEETMRSERGTVQLAGLQILRFGVSLLQDH